MPRRSVPSIRPFRSVSQGNLFQDKTTPYGDTVPALKAPIGELP
jgi:hypothetical protein